MNKAIAFFIIGLICGAVGAICFWGQFLKPQYALLIWGAGALFCLAAFYFDWRSRQWWA